MTTATEMTEIVKDAAPKVAKIAKVAKTRVAKAAKAVKVAVVKTPRVAVSEPNLRKAAARLLTSGLVSTEMAYIQRILGSTATQDELDTKVVAVRSLPWASIVEPE